jgi:hypothetical protein
VGQFGKQRDGNRLLLKVATTQGPMLVTFTQKVAELDLLLERGDMVEPIARGYATFVDDPTLERVKRPAGAGVTPSPPSTSSGSPQGSVRRVGLRKAAVHCAAPADSRSPVNHPRRRGPHQTKCRPSRCRRTRTRRPAQLRRPLLVDLQHDAIERERVVPGDAALFLVLTAKNLGRDPRVQA